MLHDFISNYAYIPCKQSYMFFGLIEKDNAQLGLLEHSQGS